MRVYLGHVPTANVAEKDPANLSGFLPMHGEEHDAGGALQDWGGLDLRTALGLRLLLRVGMRAHCSGSSSRALAPASTSQPRTKRVGYPQISSHQQFASLAPYRLQALPSPVLWVETFFGARINDGPRRPHNPVAQQRLRDRDCILWDMTGAAVTRDVSASARELVQFAAYQGPSTGSATAGPSCLERADRWPDKASWRSRALRPVEFC